MREGGKKRKREGRKMEGKCGKGKGRNERGSKKVKVAARKKSRK